MSEAPTSWSRAFDIDFQRGKVGEDLVGTFLERLEGSLIEVKTDHRANETGNVYVETHQEKRGEFVPSGLHTTESAYWVFAGPSGAGFIAIDSQVLRRLAYYSPKRTIASTNVNSANTTGRLVKVADIVAEIFKNEENNNDG